MIKTVFFDLDGTLLPMDQELFVRTYLAGLARKMAPHGYDPDRLTQGIWLGTGAMVRNDGSLGNEELFWKTFCDHYGKDAREDIALFEEFYRGEFQLVREVCGFDPRAAETIRDLRNLGLQLVLATNPLFPAIATHSRVRWAGLQPEDFSLVTTYENSTRCKPNPDYYREILDKLELNPAECLMVGNDVEEDMIAQTLGMKVFLLTDCLINRKNRNIDDYPHGGFPELLEYIRSVL